MATPSDRRRGRAVGLILIGLLPLGAFGCGRPPQVEPANRSIVLALATATSAQQASWLEECAAQIEQRRAEGQISEAADRAFASILASARAGDWEAARVEAYALRDAQDPTAESLEAVAKRTLPEPKKPERHRKS